MVYDCVRNAQTSSSDDWRPIPFNVRYEISGDKRVRVFYRYDSHHVCPHYKILKPDGCSVRLYDSSGSGKYCVDYLYELCFGVEHVESLEGEEWKPVVGYEGYYRVSNKGRLLAERRYFERKNGVRQFCKEQIVAARSLINTGYYTVNLIKDGCFKHFLVHRLVAEHFVDNPFGYPFVNHKDENKRNNSADNLEWCDASYNQRYGTVQERRIATRLRNNNGNYGYRRIANR